MGAKEGESSTGHIRAGGSHHVTVHSYLACFETYDPFISLILKFFGWLQ
jgi:hypothetical protein